MMWLQLFRRQGIVKRMLTPREARMLSVLLALLLVGCNSSFWKPLRSKPDPREVLLELGPPSAGHFKAVALADFNGDGVLDLAAGDTQGGRILVWYSGPGLTWSRPISLKVEGEVRDIAVMDLNSDGIPDLVYSLRGTPGGIYTWISTPNREKKWEAGAPAATEGLYEGLSVADVDGDGRWDLAAANATNELNGGVQVFRGNGLGGWAGEIGPTRGGIYRDVKLVDLNGDGLIDLVAAGWGPESGLRVWLRRREGGWKGLPLTARGNYWGVWASDLNRDGRIDLAAASFQKGVQVFWGKGDGLFERGDSPTEEGSFWRVRAADMDGDGAPDLLATSIDGRGVRLWLNDGRGGWRKDARSLPEFGVFYGLWVRDIDGDGRPDITVASRQDGVKIYMRGPVAPFAKAGIPDGLARAAAAARKMSLLKEQADGRNPPRPGAEEAGARAAGPVRAAPGAPAAEKASGPLIALRPPTRSSIPAAPGARGKGLAQAERPSPPGQGTEKRPAAEDWRPPGTPQLYRIGIGDKLDIAVWRGLEVDLHKVVVGEDGKIGFAFLENIQAAGLTLNQLDNEITRRLERFIKKPRLDVRVFEFNSQRFTMLGEISRPGRYPIPGPIRVFDAIIAAGGPTREAHLKDAQVLRRGRSIPVDLEAIYQGNQRTNVLLEDGDQILIPKLDVRRGAIRVVGQVPNQGSFPVTPGMRVLDAVLAAGCCRRVSGGDPLPDIRRARVIREGKVIPVNLEEIMLRGDQGQNIPLADGDQVIIPGEARGSFTVVGEVGRPGRYAIEGRTQILDVILLAGGQRDAADLTQVRVYRGGESLSVNLAQVLFQGNISQNLEIRDGDQVVVPLLPAERQKRVERARRVFALGEVRSPGVFTFEPALRDLSLLDVLTRAGGFTNFAVGSSTKIIRGDIERPQILAADVDRLLEKGDITQNVPLRDQDIVFVPRSFIGDANDWMDKIRPFLTFFLFPATYRDTYATSSEALRVDIGGRRVEEQRRVGAQPTIELTR